jgi:predicted DNA-binding transcriptional regulator AlpA
MAPRRTSITHHRAHKPTAPTRDHNGLDPNEKLTLHDLCVELKISRSTFYDWRAKHVAPPCHTLPNGQLRILRRDLDAWLRQRMEDGR